ncbi:unnamed protein product [Symbiodinium sp. CCMP2456]|nr:unnamed protein product [Symbiodinium sp. CCMP2456]
MSRHLQSNVWSDCAYSLENVKSGRWHLGSSGSWGRSEGVWKDIMTVTKAKQVCFIQRVHFYFQIKRRQVRAAVHARMNQETWDSTLEGVCFLVWVLDAMKTATTDDGAAPLFTKELLRSAFQKVLEGDYTTEADKHCLLKLPDVKPQDCAIWADHMPKDPAANSLKDCQEQFLKLDQESIQKTFEADCYKLAWDLSAFASHLASLCQSRRSAQLAKVCHVRAEMKRGSNAVVNFIERNNYHETALFKDSTVCENIKKARMAGILIVPVLASSRVGNGIRGEIRRLEDKLDAKFLDNVSVNVRMGEPHNNKRHALLYPALVCWASGGSENIFETSKLVVDRCNREPVEWMLERDYKVPTIGKGATPSTREDLDRSHSEAQEAAQHLGGLHMPKDAHGLDNNSKICCVNLRPYEGALEKACLQSAHHNGPRILSYSVGEDHTVVKYSERLLAQYLLEDWKAGNNFIGAPAFQPDPPAPGPEGTTEPTFNLCSLAQNSDGTPALALPPGIRSKWSEDSARKDDWDKLLSKFDASAHTTTAASSAAPSSSTSDKTGAIVQGSSEAWNSEPRTLDDLEARYDTLHTFPGRNANTVLKIVPASEKGQETAKLVCDGQQHKLFMVSGSEIPHSASRVSSKVCCVLNGSDLATTTTLS